MVVASRPGYRTLVVELKRRAHPAGHPRAAAQNLAQTWTGWRSRLSPTVLVLGDLCVRSVWLVEIHSMTAHRRWRLNRSGWMTSHETTTFGRDVRSAASGSTALGLPETNIRCRTLPIPSPEPERRDVGPTVAKPVHHPRDPRLQQRSFPCRGTYPRAARVSWAFDGDRSCLTRRVSPDWASRAS
jgi:hypothetical protein